jgi:hypothetical protein
MFIGSAPITVTESLNSPDSRGPSRAQNHTIQQLGGEATNTFAYETSLPLGPGSIHLAAQF